MEISWLGHSCFRLRSGELAVVTDPFPDPIGLKMGEASALLVTVSHQHGNHSYWQGVAGDPKVVQGPGEYEVSGISITGVMTLRGEGDPPGKRNTAYVIQMEKLRVCHLGDISRVLTTRQVEEIAPVDVLLLPVGGICTVAAPQAIELVQVLEPRVVIPMHYALPGLNVELRDLNIFLSEMGLKDVQPQARLNVSASSLPSEMKVVVLEPRGSARERAAS